MKKTLLTSLVLFFVVGIFAQEQKDTSNILFNGQYMPAFKITTMDGEELSSKDFKGKTVLINFFATWCGPCRKELPHVQTDIWDKYKDNPDFVLLIISREEAPAKVMPFVEKFEYPMTFYSDLDRSCYSKFAHKFIPRNYLFNEHGKLIFQSRGFVQEDFDDLLALIEKQLK